MRLIEWAVTSSILILMVVLVRALLGKRMGAGARYALWGLVLLRLLIPVQLFSVPVPESVRDALEPPAAQTAVPAPAYPPAEDGDPGTVVLTPATPASGAVQEDAPPAIHDIPGAPVTPAASAPRPFDWRETLGWLWLGGAAAMGLALVICNARFAVDLRRRRRPIGADRGLPVYAVERLESPCLFGIVRPAVYVTSETAANPAMLRHVLAHETTHARHGDQVWSLLRCAALAAHWWNPLVWLAAFLSRRDAELACDEGAIRLLGDGERKAYGWTLLTLITAQPSPASLMSAATTMSGGKKALWERVQRIAHAPKKAVWAAVLAIVLAAAVTACAFSSAAAPEEEPGESPDPTVSASPEPAGPEDAAATAQIDGRTVTLTMDYRGGNPDGEVGGATFTLICDGNQARFTDDWVEETPITLAGADLDGDGADEVVLAYTTSHLTGGLIQSLRVFDGETLDERAAFTRDDLPGVIFEQVTLTGSGDSYLLTAPGVAEIIAKSEWDESYPTETDLMNTMAFGNYYEFTVSGGRLYCDLGIWQGQCGSVRVVLGLGNGGLACKSFRYVPAAAGSVDPDAALAAYLDILNGRRAFVYSTDWGMDPMGVAGIHALFDPYDPSMRIREYALLDRDQDGVDEMVLYVCGASDDKGGCLVLDLADGVNVYGHKLDRREVGDAAWQEVPYSAPAGSGGLPFVGPFLFEFCSGAGGWSTDLTLNTDGTFTGEYSDSDMGDSGPGYHGTEYICTFHGRFGDIKQVSEHVWSLTLAELALDTGHPIGEEWTEGGTRYISSAPYGLSAAGADAPPEPGAKFVLYTPGATQKETGADEEFYWWLDMGPRMDFRCWALHNLDTDYGFLAR